MNILSLFWWIECWRVAIDRVWIQVDKYFSSEIDPYAIKIAQANYPDIVHIGDVKNIFINEFWWDCKNDDLITWEKYTHINKDLKIDLLIGGSPCQDLSIAKAWWKGLDWEKSGLFYEYVRILREVKPKYFILENVASMKSVHRDKITEVLREVYPDTEVHMINSCLVSAQNRKRLYWTNIPGVEQPMDQFIYLQDILEDIPMDNERWKPLDPKYITDKLKEIIYQKSTWIYQRPRGKNKGGIVQNWIKAPCVDVKSYRDNNFVISQFRRWAHLRIHADQENSPTLTSNMGTGGNNVPIIVWLAHRNRGEWKQPEYNGMEKANSLTTVQSDSEVLAYTWEYYWRKLTVTECERLQTLPDGYTAHVSDSRRYKAIWNGWTVNVIRHILSFIPQ